MDDKDNAQKIQEQGSVDKLQLNVKKQGTLQIQDERSARKRIAKPTDTDVEVTSPMLSKMYSTYTRNRIDQLMRSSHVSQDSKDMLDSP